MIWHDGNIIPDEALRVGIDDRVFEHGLGLFETFRSWDGRAPLLGSHLDRLRDSARTLGIALEGVRLPGREGVARLLDAAGVGGDGMLRLTVTAGSASGNRPVAWMTVRPLPAPEDLPLDVVALADSPGDPAIDRFKMLNYWGRRIAHESARSRGADEGLLIAPDGSLREGSRNNVLILTRAHARTIATPVADGSILPGIMRRQALDFAASRGYLIEERAIPLGELFDAEAAFLTNSVRGVRPVGRIDGRLIHSPDEPLSRLFVEELPKHIQSFPDLAEPST
jgi:branched-subunit amino acid aminotransferase/4-amino-4-deoxychorismate lyase